MSLKARLSRRPGLLTTLKAGLIALCLFIFQFVPPTGYPLKLFYDTRPGGTISASEELSNAIAITLLAIFSMTGHYFIFSRRKYRIDIDKAIDEFDLELKNSADYNEKIFTSLENTREIPNNIPSHGSHPLLVLFVDVILIDVRKAFEILLRHGGIRATLFVLDKDEFTSEDVMRSVQTSKFNRANFFSCKFLRDFGFCGYSWKLEKPLGGSVWTFIHS